MPNHIPGPTDKIPALLTEGEVVMNLGAVKLSGKDKLLKLNEEGKKLMDSQGGVAAFAKKNGIFGKKGYCNGGMAKGYADGGEATSYTDDLIKRGSTGVQANPLQSALDMQSAMSKNKPANVNQASMKGTQDGAAAGADIQKVQTAIPDATAGAANTMPKVTDTSGAQQAIGAVSKPIVSNVVGGQKGDMSTPQNQTALANMKATTPNYLGMRDVSNGPANNDAAKANLMATTPSIGGMRNVAPQGFSEGGEVKGGIFNTAKKFPRSAAQGYSEAIGPVTPKPDINSLRTATTDIIQGNKPTAKVSDMPEVTPEMKAAQESHVLETKGFSQNIKPGAKTAQTTSKVSDIPASEISPNEYHYQRFNSEGALAHPGPTKGFSNMTTKESQINNPPRQATSTPIKGHELTPGVQKKSSLSLAPNEPKSEFQMKEFQPVAEHIDIGEAREPVAAATETPVTEHINIDSAKDKPKLSDTINRTTGVDKEGAKVEPMSSEQVRDAKAFQDTTAGSKERVENLKAQNAEMPKGEPGKANKAEPLPEDTTSFKAQAKGLWRGLTEPSATNVAGATTGLASELVHDPKYANLVNSTVTKHGGKAVIGINPEERSPLGKAFDYAGDKLFEANNPNTLNETSVPKAKTPEAKPEVDTKPGSEGWKGASEHKGDWSPEIDTSHPTINAGNEPANAPKDLDHVEKGQGLMTTASGKQYAVTKQGIFKYDPKTGWSKSQAPVAPTQSAAAQAAGTTDFNLNWANADKYRAAQQAKQEHANREAQRQNLMNMAMSSPNGNMSPVEFGNVKRNKATALHQLELLNHEDATHSANALKEKELGYQHKSAEATAALAHEDRVANRQYKESELKHKEQEHQDRMEQRRIEQEDKKERLASTPVHYTDDDGVPKYELPSERPARLEKEKLKHYLANRAAEYDEKFFTSPKEAQAQAEKEHELQKDYVAKLIRDKDPMAPYAIKKYKETTGVDYNTLFGE